MLPKVILGDSFTGLPVEKEQNGGVKEEGQTAVVKKEAKSGRHRVGPLWTKVGETVALNHVHFSVEFPVRQ